LLRPKKRMCTRPRLAKKHAERAPQETGKGRKQRHCTFDVSNYQNEKHHKPCECVQCDTHALLLHGARFFTYTPYHLLTGGGISSQFSVYCTSCIYNNGGWRKAVPFTHTAVFVSCRSVGKTKKDERYH
jgi:hypothetical protein